MLKENNPNINLLIIYFKNFNSKNVIFKKIKKSILKKLKRLRNSLILLL